MYGLINKAIHDFVLDQFDKETWDRITERAGVPGKVYEPMTQYPDAETYTLVASASDVLKMAPEDILVGFGRYWVIYTGLHGYGDLMKSSGNSFEEFVANLDQLHTRVGLAFNDLKPPSFRIKREDVGTLLVTYTSERPGLVPLVEGLFHGLAERFGQSIEIEHLGPGHGEHDELFRITVLKGPDPEKATDSVSAECPFSPSSKTN